MNAPHPTDGAAAAARRRPARARTQFLVGAWLTFVWLALYGQFNVANTVGGILVAAVVLVLFPVPAVDARRTFRPVPALRLLVTFVRMLVVANLTVAATVLAPSRRVRPGIVDIRLFTDDDLIVTVIANSVTLTPGTISVDVTTDPAVLSVHCLALDADDVLADVRRLEALAVATFAPADDRAAYDTAASGATRSGATSGEVAP
jgi:multicomponent Na+:H+ antiporter subunit E